MPALTCSTNFPEELSSKTKRKFEILKSTDMMKNHRLARHIGDKA